MLGRSGRGKRRLMSRLLEEKLVDQTYRFTDAEAVAMSNRLAAEEGFFCGISSGANVLAALAYARASPPTVSRIVTVLCDSRDRYLNNPAYQT